VLTARKLWQGKSRTHLFQKQIMFTNAMYSQRAVTFFVGQAFLREPLVLKTGQTGKSFLLSLYASTAVKLNLDSDATEA
jgi:hypothetical protein